MPKPNNNNDTKIIMLALPVPSKITLNQTIMMNTTTITSMTKHAGGVSAVPKLYVCVDKEGQSHTRLNVLHADAAPRHRPSGDQ